MDPGPGQHSSGWGPDATAQGYQRLTSELRAIYAQKQAKSGRNAEVTANVTAKLLVQQAGSPIVASKFAEGLRAPVHSARRLVPSHGTVDTPAAADRLNRLPQRFSMSDFIIGRVVGAGSFGRVYIAKHIGNGQTYAIKGISKAACIQGGQVKHVMDERRLLVQMKHPFIVQLHGTFQDENCIYMVMEFVSGGEFFTLLRDKGRMREEHARFYAAQIVLALEYLHLNDVAYRDLKPENILVGNEGYLRLADMGFAKKISGKTFTMCGTPDYMAPEIILNKGHTKAVDWWSLGCVIYEMLFGYPPFYTGKAKETYQKILNPSSLVLPDTFSSFAKDLLQGLLSQQPEQRLGVWGQGVQVIKSHPWFGGLDWLHVQNKMYKPPQLRAVTGNDEACNFDNYAALAPLQHAFRLSPEQQLHFSAF